MMPGSRPSAKTGVGLLAALACVSGGSLWALTPLGVRLSKAKFKTPDVFWELFSSAPFLLLIGLVGLYFWLSDRHGRPGKTGFLVALVGLVLTVAGNVGQFWIGLDDTYILTAPAYRAFRLGLLVLAAGSVILATQIVLRRTLSPWSALPFAAGSVALLVAVARDLGTLGATLWIFYGICWAWLGLGLLVQVLRSLRRKNRTD